MYVIWVLVKSVAIEECLGKVRFILADFKRQLELSAPPPPFFLFFTKPIEIIQQQQNTTQPKKKNPPMFSYIGPRRGTFGNSEPGAFLKIGYSVGDTQVQRGGI